MPSPITHPSSPSLPAPGGHYSHATVANDFVFVSGQLPITPTGQKLADQPFDAQARQVLTNVEQALLAAGSGIEKLVQVRVYVDDIANWAAFNDVYGQWIGAARPSRAVVPTGALHYGFKVEVEAIAVI